MEYIAYHGTKEGFSGAASAGLGEWFGTNNETYAQQYGNVELFRIELNNPYHMDVAEFRSYDRFGARFDDAVKYREALKAKGHDGIIVNQRGGVIEYILFNKSKANKA